MEGLLHEQIREQLPCCATKCLTSGLAIIIALLIKMNLLLPNPLYHPFIHPSTIIIFIPQATNLYIYHYDSQLYMTVTKYWDDRIKWRTSLFGLTIPEASPHMTHSVFSVAFGPVGEIWHHRGTLCQPTPAYHLAAGMEEGKRGRDCSPHIPCKRTLAMTRLSLTGFYLFKVLLSPRNATVCQRNLWGHSRGKSQ